MGINRVVQFQFKADTSSDAIDKVSAKIQEMRDKCLHPDSKKPYIQRVQGDADSAPEGLQQGITHAFVIQFDIPEDRDYYALKDPAHLAVVAELGPLVEKVQIIDLPRND
ncbi:stress responsive A B barrel domain-containing protein [Fusarium phyllophilum]|uniref:Stress responsive A B barrel domain-containing protein n=1 Tax=Fusarium phyllophilum TaxID=47803 RepID=A0A8H5JXW6_9HYPO|nr:stress responsive A B barrel domain-containing protein [Fusarium phyllophilum]